MVHYQTVVGGQGRDLEDKIFKGDNRHHGGVGQQVGRERLIADAIHDDEIGESFRHGGVKASSTLLWEPLKAAVVITNGEPLLLVRT